MDNKFTKSVKPLEVKRKWHIIDASDLNLGRLAVKIAKILNGKDKENYTPHVDMGDYVVVINSKNIKLSGNKRENKEYHHYSGYPGGLKTKSFKIVNSENPRKVIMLAVKGMLPSDRLRNNKLKRLKIYGGLEHPHQAQFKS
jgi:large subunit ribosomal protein L13